MISCDFILIWFHVLLVFERPVQLQAVSNAHLCLETASLVLRWSIFGVLLAHGPHGGHIKHHNGQQGQAPHDPNENWGKAKQLNFSNFEPKQLADLEVCQQWGWNVSNKMKFVKIRRSKITWYFHGNHHISPLECPIVNPSQITYCIQFQSSQDNVTLDLPFTSIHYVLPSNSHVFLNVHILDLVNQPGFVWKWATPKVDDQHFPYGPMQIGMLCHHTFQTLPFRFTHALDVFAPTPASSSPQDMEKPRGAWQKLLEVTIVGRINWNLRAGSGEISCFSINWLF